MAQVARDRGRFGGSLSARGPARIMSRLLGVPAAVLLLAVACASSGGNSIVVRPQSAGLQMLPREITSVLQEHGYERVSVRETGIDWGEGGYADAPVSLTQQKGSIIVTHSEYRMLFRYPEDPASSVRVRIKRGSGSTTVVFFEQGRDGLSEAAERRMQAVKDSLTLRYGQHRVRSR